MMSVILRDQEWKSIVASGAASPPPRLAGVEEEEEEPAANISMFALPENPLCPATVYSGVSLLLSVIVSRRDVTPS